MIKLKLIRSVFTALLILSIILTTFAFNQPISKPQIWNLKDADIRAVIQTISVVTGKSFVVDPRVQGKVTLVSQTPLSPDELYQVFLSILHTLQYSAVSSGKVIQIVPAMDANALSRQIATSTQPGSGDEIVVRVVPLNYVSASELVPILRPLMSQFDNVTAYLPTNALILSATASNIERLMKIISQMDQSDLNHIDVIHLRYANAKKIVDVIHSLQEVSQSQGKVNNVALAADADGNSILLSGNLANQLMIRRLIHELDRQDSGEDAAEVVQLNYLTAKTFAPILTKIAQGMDDAEQKDNKGILSTSTAHTISIQSEPDNNAIILRAPKEMLSHLMQIIHHLDVRPQEVLVEAIIVKVDENLLNQLGIVWGTRDLNADGTEGAGSALDASTAGSANNTFALKVNHGVGFLPSNNLVALIHLLKSNGSSDVLSTPSVVVLNNQKAVIDDGQNVGLANRSYQGVNATPGVQSNIITPFNTIERQNVTLSLAVIPHISPNQMIRLQLAQQDDSIANGEGTDNPTLNTSTIKTTVLVKSGDVLVLGGLINNEQQKEKQKVPVLGDLPLIGQIFRYDTHKMQKRSLMIFIRPVIMSKQSAQSQTIDRYAYIQQWMNHQNTLMHLPAPHSTHMKSA